MATIANVRTNNLRNSVDSIREALLLRSLPNVSQVMVTGASPAAGIAAASTVWDIDAAYTYLTANTALFLTSSDAGDTTQTATIVALRADNSKVTIVKALNGQTPVPLVTTVKRIVSITLDAVAAGDVYLAETDTYTAGVPDTATKIKGKVLIGNTAAKMAMYTVPDGKDALLLSFSCTGELAAGTDSAVLRYRQDPADPFLYGPVILANGLFVGQDPSFNGLRLTEGADVEIQAFAAAGTNAINATMLIAEFPAGSL